MYIYMYTYIYIYIPQTKEARLRWGSYLPSNRIVYPSGCPPTHRGTQNFFVPVNLWFRSLYWDN